MTTKVIYLKQGRLDIKRTSVSYTKYYVKKWYVSATRYVKWRVAQYYDTPVKELST